MGELWVGSSTGARAHLERVSDQRWTKKKRETFLNTLAATCNVTVAAAACGCHPCTAYRLRHRDAGFAELWRLALIEGYDRLEGRLLEHAGAALNAIEIDGEAGKAAAPFDPKLAMDLLRQHRATLGRVEGAADPEVRSAMPGTVISVTAATGTVVEAGQPLLTIEAMKMEHTMLASVAGVVTITVASGDQVRLDQVVARIDPHEGAAE